MNVADAGGAVGELFALCLIVLFFALVTSPIWYGMLLCTYWAIPDPWLEAVSKDRASKRRATRPNGNFVEYYRVGVVEEENLYSREIRLYKYKRFRDPKTGRIWDFQLDFTPLDIIDCPNGNPHTPTGPP